MTDGRARLKAAYTNDRRAGRTQPGKIEGRDFNPTPGGPDREPNRRDYRASGMKGKTGGPRIYPKGRRQIGNRPASAFLTMMARRSQEMADLAAKRRAQEMRS